MSQTIDKNHNMHRALVVGGGGDDDETSSSSSARWVRGINLGGWLMLERYIIPYQFALTDCHVNATSADEGLCWYPGALSAPPKSSPQYRECDLDKCRPYRTKNLFDSIDYPVDEWHLASAFKSRNVAEVWFNTHFENFVTRDDFVRIKKAGLTHVRIPLPHWILGDVLADEPWMVGNRWQALQRAVQWARELDLQVWPNLHTAPGSQNGFDNSGIEGKTYTADGWWKSPENVGRTIRIIDEITRQMADDDMLDVVTGFGLLNEPFGDCDMTVYTRFLNEALAVARKNMGQEAKIFVADRFAAPKFNNGTWWLDEPNTYLDSHIYHVFSNAQRFFDPVEHMKGVCHPEDAENTISSCCWVDPPKNTTAPKNGVRRISTEWSAAFDAMPGELLGYVMQAIATNGTAPNFYRTLSRERGSFLHRFVQAQMVSLEDEKVSDGWFYWTWKTEGGAFAEWDFLQGFNEGWMPKIINPNKASAAVYGTCDQLIAATRNDTSIVHPYPWGDEPYWKNGCRDAQSSDNGADGDGVVDNETWNGTEQKIGYVGVFGFVAVLALFVGIMLRRRHPSNRGYTSVKEAETTTLQV